MQKTKFTIITVCLNAGEELVNTVKSIRNQKYSDWELIIKDGNSQDQSVVCINRIKDSRIKIIVKRDMGIYSAMNQAIEFARGEYVLFLNAGDLFDTDYVLQETAELIEKNSADIFYGNYKNALGDVCMMPRRINKFFLYRSFLCHQSVFYSSNVLEKFPEDMKILADHFLHVKLYINKHSYQYLPITICRYQGGGLSENTKFKKVYRQEKKRIIDQFYRPTEVFFYSLAYHITLPKLRMWLAGDQSPDFLRLLYRRIVTTMRRRGL